MEPPAPTTDLDLRVTTFAGRWLQLGEAGVGDDLLADPILVLGADGTVPVPRATFLAAVAGRAAAVGEAAAASTTLTGTTAVPLGDRMVLATISWSFGEGDEAPTLVSDFLLQREGDDRLRCVAYLPRTSVLDHVE
jgi:hypothetical protein